MSNEYEPKYGTIAFLLNVLKRHGNVTLEQTISLEKGDRIYMCPSCRGRGYVKHEYNAYPNGLPDSGFVYEPGFKDEKCKICNGIGFTKNEMRPKIKMVQSGWEEVPHDQRADHE